jgi:putative transposase
MALKHRLHRGLLIRLNGQGECRIEKRLTDSDLQLKNIVTNEYISVSEERIIAAWLDGALEFLGDAQGPTLAYARPAQTTASELSLLDEDLKAEVKRRFAYISVLKAKGETKGTREILSLTINEVSEEINDSTPPSTTTLWRWNKRYTESDEDLLVLTPAHHRKGNTQRKLASGDRQKSDEIVKLIDEVIEEKYLSKERPTVARTYDSIVSRIIAINDFRAPEDSLPIPHRDTVYAIVHKLDPFVVMKSRYGERLAKQKYDPVKHGPRTTRPLERVEMDHTKIDFMVVDPVMRLPVGRPCVTTALDHFTREILGKYMSFNPPSYLSVMHCLQHAIAPKSYIKEQYPNIVNTWDAYGLPELIVVDNGPEFHSIHFEDACLQLGINIHYAPPKQGKYKGSIERWFGTQNKQLLHGQRGTTFSNILDRADYDSKANAIITITALEEMSHIYIVDVYHQQKHRGINDIPARLWKEAIAEYPPSLPPHRTALDVLLGCIEYRTVSAKGIELHSLFYNDDSLALLRRKLNRNARVMLKYDPSDLSIIHVADREHGVFLPIPAVNQDYAQGLSLWQHEMIKAFARRRVSEHVDIVALSRAKQRIQEIVEREWLAAKRTSTRQKLARVLNHGHEKQIQLKNRNTSQDRLALVGGNALPTLPELEMHNATAGASNFESPSDAEQQRLTLTKEKTSSIQLSQVATKNGADKPKNTRTSSRRSAKVKVDSIKSLVVPTLNVHEDEVLDMTGWDADYNLPG